MNVADPWDWELLYYVGTVLLKRSDVAFWKMTPRTLNALTRVHGRLNGGEKKDKQAQPGFIDQVI